MVPNETSFGGDRCINLIDDPPSFLWMFSLLLNNLISDFYFTTLNRLSVSIGTEQFAEQNFDVPVNEHLAPTWVFRKFNEIHLSRDMT